MKKEDLINDLEVLTKKDYSIDNLEIIGEILKEIFKNDLNEGIKNWNETIKAISSKDPEHRENQNSCYIYDDILDVINADTSKNDSEKLNLILSMSDDSIKYLFQCNNGTLLETLDILICQYIKNNEKSLVDKLLDYEKKHSKKDKFDEYLNGLFDYRLVCEDFSKEQLDIVSDLDKFANFERNKVVLRWKYKWLIDDIDRDFTPKIEEW